MKSSMGKGMLIAFFASAALNVSYANTTGNRISENKMVYSKPAMNLMLDMRMLWEDHIGYTHQYIVSSLAGAGDTGKVAARLMKNQEEIGNAIRPYYGDNAGKKLTDLLKDHISIATEVVAAAKAGATGNSKKASDKWSANADSIASFLSGANPNWPKKDVADMMHKHLSLINDQVAARLRKDWQKDIDASDEGHRHMLMFSDVLAEGIVKQYPNKFAR